MTFEELEQKLLETEKRLLEAERKIQINSDIEAVKKVQSRYINALARVNWDEIIDCFADDSSIDVEFGGFIRGKENIARFFREMLSTIHDGKEGIFEVHPVVTVDGDTAKGNWLMYIMYADPRTWASRYWLQAVYDSEFVRVNGEWKFKHLQWRPRLEPPGPPPPTMAP